MTLGALMNTRSLMELIVLNVGYDISFLLPPSDFAMPVLMAVGTTLMTAPLLQWLPPRLGHTVGKEIEA